ncbi:MAG: hypothetical protein KU37_10730 [Sulfuricurvum sp. PC08-66]|nr:MAG: hypothetical protein KU37_10730 [Sulfuricurvum sp. PC08-66]
MQGYILAIHRVRDEDTIVTLLTPDYLHRLYRFYGARHSIINIGYKIDFEIEQNPKTTIERLRHVWQLPMGWFRDRERLHIWQRFVALFASHLRDSSEIDPFYFTLLEDAATLWQLKNPKRIVIESYIKLLAFEGRLHRHMECFLCEMPLDEAVTLTRAFLPAHPACAYQESFPLKGLQMLLHEGQALLLEDDEVDRLYEIVLEGL